MSECDGGLPPASPTATPTRLKKSMTKFTATPHTAVIALHNATANASTLRRFDRSAHAANGMPKNA